jgi:hypothetical protein
MILLANYINRHSNKILFLIFSVFFCTGTLLFKDFGVSIDEEFHRFSGFYWLNYVIQFLPFENLKELVLIKINNINGFTLPDPEYFPAYGIIFDLPLAYLETVLHLNNPKNIFLLRHFVNFLIFFTSSIFFYKLLLNRFSNFNISIIGTIFYITSPRIFGNSFYNNKDLVFLSIVTIALYFCFKNFDNLKLKNLILFALFSALATSARIYGIFLPLSFVLMYFFYILDNKINFNIFYKIIFFLLTYLIFLIILWPYLWEAPLNNFFIALAQFSKHHLEIKMLFFGKYISSNILPISYIPSWIIFTTPLITLILFFLGFYYMVKRVLLRFINIKKKSNYSELWRNINEKKDLYIFLNFSIIFLYLIFADIILYNGWRQIYFLNIFLIYIVTYSLYILFTFNKNLKLKFYSNLFLILFFIFIVSKLAVYHPYQSFYFNSLTSNELKKNMEIDYWGISGVKFLKRVLEIDKKNKISIGVASYLPLERSMVFLEKKQRNRINIVGQDYEIADYIFDSNISEVDKNINTKYNVPKNFIKIEEFTIEKATVFKVYKKS